MLYTDFINAKRHTSISNGIEVSFLPDALFDFQKYLTEYAINKGRCGIFLDTGLGKTIIELTIAHNYTKKTNKHVLILTPLAVAFQFILEAEKFKIPDVYHTKDGNYKGKGKIILVNYERLHYMNAKDFDCVILDESSILKNYEGQIKNHVTDFLKKVKYRFLFTATPSPNDYIELGTSSEALGYLGYTDMLGQFFKNNQNNTIKLSRTAQSRQGEKWYLKPHAEQAFWNWVSSWSKSAKKPSDLGFSDDKFTLPQLIEQQTIVRNPTPLEKYGMTPIFSFPANGFQEIKKEAKITIEQRCEIAVEKTKPHPISVYWCLLNDEAKCLSSLDKLAVEINGSMPLEQKEDILHNFSTGNIKRLITKPTITAFGLNWQHCNHTTYFPSYSYEQYYQSIRRFWRFGQKKPVTVDLIYTDGQKNMMKALLIKKEKAITMFENLIKSANTPSIISKKDNIYKEIKLPNFLK